MIDERISVSAVSLESLEAYIKAAQKTIETAATLPAHAAALKLRFANNDLNRALECLTEAKMTDEEVRETH